MGNIHSDVTIGVPAIIGKKGVEKIIELDLNDEEKQVFNKAVESVKGAKVLRSKHFFILT